LILESLKKQEITFSNFYKDPIDSSVDLDIYVPIIEKERSYVIVLKIDPNKILFPLIQNWYLPNSTIESFIVFKQGSSVVFANRLKYNNSAPLSYKLPLSTKNLPAAMAVSGIQKIVEGTDYRGEKVLADIRRIGNTSWFLITKQDLSEIYLPASNRLSFILLLLFWIPAVGGIIFLYFQGKQNYLSQQKIIESNKKFETLYQESKDGILLMDGDRIINCNNISEKIFGSSSDKILNKTLLDFSPYFQPNGRNSKDKLFKILNDTRNGKGHVFEWAFNSNGKEFVCEINIFPLRIDEMNFTGAIIRDITERRNIEAQNQMLLYAIHQSPSSIVITNAKGKIEYVNPKFTSITGYNFDEVIGRNPRILKSGELAKEVYEKLWETITSGLEWRGEFHNKKKNKELYWEMASISPIKDGYGNITHFIAIKEDITEAKLTRETLDKITKNLIEQNKYLEQFGYIISHNLRAPVANIIGMVNILNEDNIDENDKQELMSGLNYSVKKLDEVIMDLNEILQVKSGINEVKEKVYFSKKVEDVKESISKIIEEESAEIKYDFSEADEIYTIKSYLRSIFYNLITNSIKYRKKDQPPLIEIKSKRRNDGIELVFKDNGLGIDLTKKGDQVFGLYKRFHSHTEGKGLGLFMTKMQVEALNGKIEIKSEVDKGTEFIITFYDEEV
jgi:PAS domain S-box-containing protein